MGILDAIPDLILGGAIISLKRLKVSLTGLFSWADIHYQISFTGLRSGWILFHLLIKFTSALRG